MNDEIHVKYRLAGRIAGQALEHGTTIVEQGKKLVDVADEIEAKIREKGGKPAFPVNIAINEVAAHFTPKHNDKRVFEIGELVKIDVGVHVDGYIGDTARTVEVGSTDNQGLIAAAKAALASAIEAIKPDMMISTIGSTIEKTFESFGVKPVANLTGHSMERFNLHAGKSIPNIADASEELIEEGDILAIEPFSTTGIGRVEGRKGGNIYRIIRRKEIPKSELNDFLLKIHEEYSTLPFSERWCHTIEKKSESYLKKLIKHGAIMSYPILSEVRGSMVAQAEHTVIVTGTGCEVIT